MRCNGSMLQFHAAVGLDQNLAWLSCAGWWHGGTVFAPHIAAFEIHIPGRENAKNDYTPDVCAARKKWFSSSTQEDRSTLLTSIMVGLAGAYTSYSIDGLQKALGEYQRISRANYALISPVSLWKSFPTADELSMYILTIPHSTFWINMTA